MIETRITYKPRGSAAEIFSRRDPELLLSGPAGTGKSRAALEKIHLVLSKYEGARGLALRKTLNSLTSSGLVTFRKKVLHPSDGVRFFSGNKEVPAQYIYPNASVLVMGGLDKPTKVMSTEYDVIFIQEATEVSENDWESVTTRLRNHVVPYQQLLADCNPDAPYHWLKRRADRGGLLMLESRHEENPVLFDEDGTLTESGVAYMAKLDRLTGTRKQRLRYGRWVGAEGIVYEEYDRALHLLDRFEIPSTWRRFRSIDFGYSNPFTCQWWTVDHDGRMYLYRELYMTGRIVSEHAARINALSRGERIEATVADHDAEDRATLHDCGIPTITARKDVSPGIQAVSERMQPAGDGKPRLFILRDSLIEQDIELFERGMPTCLDQELDSYIWAPPQDGKAAKEEPLKHNDHGADAMRYMVMHLQAPAMSAGRFAVSGPRPVIPIYEHR